MSPGATLDSAASARKTLALSLVGLALFLAWQALALRSHVRSETRPPAWDQAIHLEIALDYREALKEGRWSDALHLAPKPGMPPFPPLYHLALMRAYDDSNPAGAALWINWLYLALLCVSIFAIAWEFKPDATALAAAMIFAGSPVVQELLTTQLADLALAACVAAAYWALLRSEGFSRWGGSLAFGALFAFGMMHKWSFFSYMIPAYYLAALGLSSPAARPKVLAAAGAAVLGFGPWYAAHLPVMLPRLFDAASDFAIPVWKGGAFFTYFLNMSESLGPPFWLLGWAGLLAAHYKRRADRGWILAAWILSSYIFWAVVPNRQMRFLLPGLPGLAVAACAAWPAPVAWALAAFQLLAAANFHAGWISPIRIPLPVRHLVFLPSQPPVQEDWKIGEILRQAQARHEGGSPVANLTLVANPPYFNGPNFTWTVKYLKLPNVRLRGVNRRLCEFSEFVLLKDAKLGPEGVISGLPEASRLILDPGSWFARGYKEVRRWPLPDKTNAVLYQRRRPASPPFKEGSIRFDYYQSGPFTARNMKVDLGRWDRAASAYALARVRAGEIELRGLKVRDVSVEFEDLFLVPAAEPSGPAAWDDVRFLKMGRLRFRSARVEAEDLKAFLEARVKGLKVQEVSLDGTLKVKADWRHLSLSAEASLRSAPSALRVEILKARVGLTPIPTALLGRFRTFNLPFEPNPETPFAIDLPGLSLRGGRLTIP